MRYIKSINEFFDSEEIKSSFGSELNKEEIKKLVKDTENDIKMSGDAEKLYHNIIMNYPIFNIFTPYGKGEKDLILSFEKKTIESDEVSNIDIKVDIVKTLQDKYILSFACVFLDGKDIAFNFGTRKMHLNLEELMSSLNSIVIRKIETLDKLVKSKLGYSLMNNVHTTYHHN